MNAPPATTAPPERTPVAVKNRLYLMMFLQYFVQGSFLPVISVYLQEYHGFGAKEIGYFGAAIAVGPLLAPFLIGQLVDRHMATEKVLAACHLVGGGVMFALFYQDRGATYPVITLGTIYSILYFPTLMLTNSLTFHHLVDRDREFPFVRLWGTIGFVVPAWAVEMYFLSGLTGDDLNQARGIILIFSAVSGLLMGGYSFLLPHTPPPGKENKEFAPAKVLRLLTHRNFLMLVLVSLIIAVAHKFFFVWNSPFLKMILARGDDLGAWEQRIASIGQIFEVLVMAGLGWSLKKYGFKWTMGVGGLAYVARCIVLAGAAGWALPFSVTMTLACVGQALHGLCFGCFLASAYIYVDHVAPIDVRGSMQTIYGTFVVGTGFFVGGFVSGEIGNYFTAQGDTPLARAAMGITSMAGIETTIIDGVTQHRDWPGIWLSGGAIALVGLIAFLIAFPGQSPDETESAAEST